MKGYLIMDFNVNYEYYDKTLSSLRTECTNFVNKWQTFYEENIANNSFFADTPCERGNNYRINHFAHSDPPFFNGYRINSLSVENLGHEKSCGIDKNKNSAVFSDGRLTNAKDNFYTMYDGCDYGNYKRNNYKKKNTPLGAKDEYTYEYESRSYTDSSNNSIQVVYEECDVYNGRYSDSRTYQEDVLRNRQLQFLGSSDNSFISNMLYDEMGRFSREELDYQADGTIDMTTVCFYDEDGYLSREEIDYAENDNWSDFERWLYSTDVYNTVNNTFGGRKPKFDKVITHNNGVSNTEYTIFKKEDK